MRTTFSAFYAKKQFLYFEHRANLIKCITICKILLTPHADLLIVARLEFGFVECKHHKTNFIMAELFSLWMDASPDHQFDSKHYYPVAEFGEDTDLSWMRYLVYM